MASKESTKRTKGKKTFTEDDKDRYKAEILANLQEWPHKAQACDRAGVSYITFWRWRKEDPAYDALVEEAMKMGDERLVDAAMEKALQDRDTTMIIFLLKTRIRDTYGERMEHTGPEGHPIQILISQREDGPQ